MPSTFSPALRLELIGNGEQSANWGNTTNTNLGTLLEQAVTGVGNITMADANYTLVNGNGISDEARNAVLVVSSGVSLTATRNVVVPTSNKFYAVRNATTGSQSILVKTSAGSGVTLANGFTQLMYCDGTNVVAATSAFNAATNTVSVNVVGNVVGDVVGNLTGAASSNVLKAGDTMTGDLTIAKATPLITLNKAAASQNAFIASQTAGSFRWIIVPGDNSAESGSNAGSNFGINRYSDAGAYIDTPLSITRSTGVVNFSAIPVGPASNPTANDQLARKAYVDTKATSGAVTTSGLTQATARILGRTTAGTGAVEEISVGSGLALSSGSLAAGGRAYAEYTTYATLTAQIPNDDTIPQNTEGTQILTASITPKNAANRVRVRIVVRGVISDNVGRFGTISLFRGAGADAIAATSANLYLASNTSSAQIAVLEFEDSPGSTAEQTYNVRVGPSGGTLYINGSNSTRLYGGVMRATLVLEEIIL